MQRSTERILTTHAGSLVRTPEVVSFMYKIEHGVPYDVQEFDRCLTSGVGAVVKQQAAVGVDIPSDGEFGKRGWTQYVAERLAGLAFEAAPGGQYSMSRLAGAAAEQFQGFYEVYNQIERTLWLPHIEGGAPESVPLPVGSWVCIGPVSYQGQAAVHRDIANFKAALADVDIAEAFMPVVAPCSVESNRPNRYYASEEAYLYAIAEALRQEYETIVNAGLVLQVDDAWMPAQWACMAPGTTKEEYRKYVQVRVEALNYALRNIPEDRVRYHICWGSQNVPHTWDVPLRDIVDLVLEVKAQAYSIEAANPQHEHEWQVWEEVTLPAGKILIPGVIMHATNIVEHPDLIAWRIGNFARLVGRENVIAGTDCGFSQNWNLARVHPEVQWAKLAALAEGARRATQQLWGRA